MRVGSEQWMEKFQNVVNTDQELNVIGNYCTIDFLLQIGSTEYVIELQQGKMKGFSEKGALDRWSFAIRGSLDAWEKFTQPIPPAMFHELFAAFFQGNMQIDGDTQVLMANLRYMSRFLDLTREVDNVEMKGA